MHDAENVEIGLLGCDDVSEKHTVFWPEYFSAFLYFIYLPNSQYYNGTFTLRSVYVTVPGDDSVTVGTR